MKNVILSTALVLEEGNFSVKTISLEEAKQWVQDNNPVNFSGHQTVKAVGVKPANTRGVCEGYDNALVLKPNGRVEFREYSLEEILEIGVTPMLITKS